jgi:RNA polymerase sigma-70 factor (ECF subfamily)
MHPGTDSGASVFPSKAHKLPSPVRPAAGVSVSSSSVPMPALTSEPSDAWLLETLERYEKPLLKYALGQCGDREMARDAVQDTFLSLASEVTRARPQNLSAWLFSVCRNRLIDIRRKQFRLVPLEDDHLERDFDGIPAPSARIETEEKNTALLRMVESLPERERELVRLKFQAGLSYREISEITGITEGHVGYLLHHAVKELRDQWLKEGHGR